MKKIYLSPPSLGKSENRYIKDAIQSNWIAPVGPFIDKFENRLKQYTGVEHALCVNSGTSAIHLALKVLGVKKGDIVLCQNFTFIGSVSPVKFCDAEPIFIGSEESTWNISPEILRDTIKKFLKKGKKPKAIIIVHLYGMPAKVSELKSISREFNIPIIEDAAEALGSTYMKKKCGSLFDIGILSFNGNKIITTSGGGAILSNKKKYIDKAKYLANQAKDNLYHYQHREIGYNYRISNLLSALGVGQLESINKKVKKRRNNFLVYKELLSSFDNFIFPMELINQNKNISFSNRWLSTLIINKKYSVKNLTSFMQKKNIEVRPLWKPMNIQPIFSDIKYFGDNVEHNLYKKGVCLPSGNNLTRKDQEKVIYHLLKYLS